MKRGEDYVEDGLSRQYWLTPGLSVVSLDVDRV